VIRAVLPVYVLDFFGDPIFCLCVCAAHGWKTYLGFGLQSCELIPFIFALAITSTINQNYYYDPSITIVFLADWYLREPNIYLIFAAV